MVVNWQTAPDDNPTESVADDAPELGAARLRWEPVNVHVVGEALKLDAIRRVHMEYYSAFDVLLSIQRRATNVRGKVGWIAVVERESKPKDNKPQRLDSGIHGLDTEQMPTAVLRELKLGVPVSLAGVSAFHFSRSLKYLIRGGLGMVEYDAVNAYFQIMKMLLPELAGAPREYCDNREHHLQAVSQCLTKITGKEVTRDDATQLFLSIGFGGSVHGWCCS